MINIKKYDDNNIFAKILRKEIHSECIFEDDDIYAFKDINPQAPIHVLIIPKQKFCSFDDFCSKAEEKTIFSFFRSIKQVAEILDLKEGYRIISNIGDQGGQEVPHFHIHLIAGKKLGSIVN